MKVTVFQFEGTPQELDGSDTLRGLVSASGTRVVRTELSPDAGDGKIPGVPDEGQQVVQTYVKRGPAPELFVAFLAKTSTWEGVAVHGVKPKGSKAGAPLDYSRYLRLRKQGSRYGGFAYVRPDRSSVNFRLSYSLGELKKLGTVSARVLTTGHNRYRVSVDLSDKGSLEDALRLAEIAYKET